MTKISKVFQIFTFCAIALLFVELVMLFSQIDLLPFMVIGFICGLSIILRNSSDDFFYSDNIVKDTGLVFRFVLITLLDIILFSCFMVVGIENIAKWVLFLLESYKIIRFIIYGVVFPIITSYLMTWFWTDSKPNLSVLYAIVMPNSMGVFYRILFVNLMIGMGVCIFWIEYFKIAIGLLKFF